ncbi:MAG: hypothetical protein J7455_08730 [Roseiflexus sp.]|nr:hypothetical protein [Roseiflexus sp.]MBO9366113.1 hypothetical protein [Roseiflexus sp.]MBO9390342.1 hypothetical protein [Roseiflexus sp.]
MQCCSHAWLRGVAHSAAERCRLRGNLWRGLRRAVQGARIGRRALQVRLHLAIAEVGETSGAVAFSDHPLVGWIGAVTCVLPVAAPGAARSGHLAIGGPGAAAARGTGHR